jgi:hypothetical protein
MGEEKILVALVVAFASLAVAVVNFLANRSNQGKLERLRAKLEEQQAERDALRDYEYEARKQLYHKTGPLLFQLIESSEGGSGRSRGFLSLTTGFRPTIACSLPWPLCGLFSVVSRLWIFRSIGTYTCSTCSVSGYTERLATILS